jgi:hypothetical protein
MCSLRDQVSQRRTSTNIDLPSRGDSANDFFRLSSVEAAESGCKPPDLFSFQEALEFGE